MTGKQILRKLLSEKYDKKGMDAVFVDENGKECPIGSVCISDDGTKVLFSHPQPGDPVPEESYDDDPTTEDQE